MNISASVLSWNELEVVSRTVNRLKKEPIEIWVVDNGSEDGTQEWLKEQEGINVIQLKKNIGAGPARNKVIEKFEGDYLLMIDSDILYIPGAAKGLAEILAKLDKAYCLGIHNNKWDGTPDEDEADKRWVGPGRIREDHPMAWTQFGVFKRDLIRKYNFPEHGAFKGPGYGYEDDWVNAVMAEKGYKAYYCARPLYYHKAHTTKRHTGGHHREKERKKELYKRFPNYQHWREKLKEDYLGGLTMTYLANKR